MTKIELILTFAFVWGTVWFIWLLHNRVKRLEERFTKLVDLVKENITEPKQKTIVSLNDVDFPKWFNPEEGGIWNIDTTGNIIIVQQGFLPHMYDEDTKIWKSLSEMPEFVEAVSRN